MMDEITVFLEFDKVPRTTHQQKKGACRNGQLFFYEPKNVKATRQLFMSKLKEYKPNKPISTACQLNVVWYFDTKNKKDDNKFKTTRPDLDNLNKLLQDCLVKSGYLSDDSIVVRLLTEKRYSLNNSGISIYIKELEEM